jgi:4-amino-4-deoxychorismate lyase
MLIINGELKDELKINLDDGYMFGRGVFETILIKNKPIFLKEHLKRLNEGINRLTIKNIIEEKFVLSIIESYNINNCVLKIIVTDKNIVFSTRINPYDSNEYEQGINIKLSHIKRNPYSHFTYIKSLNYIDNLLEREAAQKQGFKEVIFLNVEDKLAEGSATNIFFVKNNNIYTPSLDCGILDGVIRQWMFKNFPVVEGKFSFEELLNSDGVFITNSLMGIMQVNHIDDYTLSHCNIIKEIKETYELCLLKMVNSN